MLKVLEVSKIVQGKNIRNERDSEILELAESIEKNGLINPITVQELGDGRYEVIAGHRRFEAVKRLGLPHIECNIADMLNEKDIILTQLAENVQRKQMSAYELVMVFEELKKKYHMKQNVIAQYFGKSEGWVSNQYQAIRLLEAQYGNKIPKSEKKKGAAVIKGDAKKLMSKMELIICEGMRIQVSGHKYTIFCSTNEAENELRDFIKAHKAGR